MSDEIKIKRETCKKQGCEKELNEQELLDAEKAHMVPVCAEHMEWLRETLRKTKHLWGNIDL